MANILVINELGKGFGHVARSGIILNGLINAGHQVSFASNKLSGTEQLFIGDEVELYSVPRRTDKEYGNKVACNYAEYLLKRGFSDPAKLAAAIKKYHVIFKKSKADIAILDHAPIAAMALRSFVKKHVPFFHVGSSYVRPPLTAPFPNITPWEYINPERLELAERLVIANIHAAMKSVGSKQIGNTRDLFTQHDLLDTWQEFDHFRDVTDASYIGPVYQQYTGQRWQWKTDRKMKIFAYLNESYVGFSTLLAALGKCDAEVLCVVNTTDEKLAMVKARANYPHFHLTNVPVNLDDVIGNVSVYVGNAGLGITTQMLLSGVPAVIAPSNTEHHLFCIAAEKQGVLKVLDPGLGIYSMSTVITETAEDHVLRSQVKALCGKYHNNTPSTAMRRIIATAEALLEEEK